MNAVSLLIAVALSAAVLGFASWLWRRMAKDRHLPSKRAVPLLIGGLLVAILATALESWALGFFGLSIRPNERGTLGAALSMLLFCSPLEEALKVAAIWPLYVRRRLASGQVGAIYAVLVAAGFSAGEILAMAFDGNSVGALPWVRAAFAVPAHLFFAGVWGYFLGGGGRDRFFGITWLACTALHGVYDHIVFGRGPGLLVIVIPMLATMAVGVFGLLREQGAVSTGRRTAYSLFEPPTVGSVRDVLTNQGRPLMIHWILIGAFVNLGVTLVFLAGSVYLGHRYGIDFSLVDEAGIEGILPIALLGGALLASFPVSAYLIARASGAASVLEPAWATGAAIIVVLALFSVTEPTALVIALGIAPVGFTLACAGAWFGLERV